MDASSHGCHHIHAPSLKIETPDFCITANAEHKPMTIDGTTVLFSSVQRADQFYRKAKKEDSYYIQKISTVQLSALVATQDVILNPCAHCSHRELFPAGTDTVAALKKALENNNGKTSLYLQDVQDALDANDQELALELLLLVVAHLAPDNLSAHTQIAKLATAMGDTALAAIAQKNIAAFGE